MLTSKLFAKPLKREYGEMPQANPLRWCVYYYDDLNETFTAQTDWFKCKDFFNDFVAKYHGVEGRVYGMSTSGMSINDYGMWLRLKALYPAFYKNALLVAEKFGVELTLAPFDDDSSQCLTLLPRALFKSTYTISLFTLLLRAANNSQEFSSYEELVKTSKERLLSYTEFKKAPFILPESLQKYWCYMGSRYNSQYWEGREKPQIEAVHNNGFLSWIQSDTTGAFK